jgi:hypothetical protein
MERVNAAPRETLPPIGRQGLRYSPVMGVLAALRRWLGKADEATTEFELSTIEHVHRAEDAVDEATGGRFYDALEKADEEAEALHHRLHPGETDEGGREESS